jgi:hypothetical protein
MPQPPAPPVEMVPIDTLFCSPTNPRQNDASIPHVAASLRRLEWQQPVVARRTGEVIAVNTRLLAAQHLCMTEVPVWCIDGTDLDAVAEKKAHVAAQLGQVAHVEPRGVSRDGVVAAFTCAELMPLMGRTRAFVAWAVDDQELPADEGPMRIVVASDRKGSRSLRRVAEVQVVDARQVEAR